MSVKHILIASLLLLTGCATPGEAGRFVGSVLGSGVRSALDIDRDNGWRGRGYYRGRGRYRTWRGYYD